MDGIAFGLTPMEAGFTVPPRKTILMMRSQIQQRYIVQYIVLDLAYLIRGRRRLFGMVLLPGLGTNLQRLKLALQSREVMGEFCYRI